MLSNAYLALYCLFADKILLKALQLTGYGGNSVVSLALNAPLPAVSPGTVLVNVYQAALNPWTGRCAPGRCRPFYPLEFLATIGGGF